MMKLQQLAIVASTCCTFALAFVDYGYVQPAKYSIQATLPKSSNLSFSWANTTSLKVSPTAPLLLLDFETEVAGFPYFDVSKISGPAQVEVKYAEEFDSLSNPNSDGPWTFVNGLSNTFRVETFNITNTGRVSSYLVQGGQRWVALRLLTNETITIGAAGFRATSAHQEPHELPGQLQTSKPLYNHVFNLGGRVVQVACIDAGNAPSPWEITPLGALVRGSATGQCLLGASAANYTLEFSTKIVRGGTGWRVASSSAASFGPYFVLTSNYPVSSTFVNTNRTLLPPNTLIFNSQWSLLNQTTLETAANQYYPVKVTIEEDQWYRVSTEIQDTGYQVSLDGKAIAFIPNPKPSSNYFATPSTHEGTWGFGGFQEHISYFANVSVTARNGSKIYKNTMTSEDILAEYGVAELDHSVCLDGAKRDRLVWIGDFYHTVRVIALSSARFDYILSTIEYVFSYQAEQGLFAGFVPISASMGTRPGYESASSSFAGLVDYQDLFLAGIGEYFRYTDDIEGLKPYWANTKKLADAKLAFVDPASGLVAGTSFYPSPSYFLGPANGSAVTGLSAFALEKLASLASAMQDEETSKKYADAASGLRDALNQQLWSDELGTYALSTSSPGNFSLTGIAWAILCGAANATQAASSIAKLEELRFGVGYRTVSSEEESADYQLAPNPSGFLLEALFMSIRDHGSNSTAAVSHLLDDLWGSMVNNDMYYSGASWEYVTPNGAPGLDLFTSLAHPWGAAPTYVLPEYLVGIVPTTPGYKAFTVRPLMGLLGLSEVSGRVPTPYGAIEVSWTISVANSSITVMVPEGTHGVLDIPQASAKNGDMQVELRTGRNMVTLRLD